jgi:hypothetical protein
MSALLAEFHYFKGAIINTKAHRGTSGPIEYFEFPNWSSSPYLLAPSLILALQSNSLLRSVNVCLLCIAKVLSYALVTSVQASHNKLSAFWIRKIQHINLTSILSSIQKYYPSTTLLIMSLRKSLILTWHLVGLCVSVPRISLVFIAPHPVYNHFLKGLLSEDSTITFHITVTTNLTDTPANLLV